MIKNVIKRDGSKQKFMPEKINGWGEWGGMDNTSWSDVVMQTVDRFDGECSSEEIQDTMIEICLGKKDPAAFKMAGRLYAGQYFKQLFGGHDSAPSLVDFYRDMTDKGIWKGMNYSVRELKELDKVLDHSEDLSYSYTSLKQIKRKYAINNKFTKTCYETPQLCFMRVAMATMNRMPKERRLYDVKKLFNYLKWQWISPSTPFLNGPGTGFNGYASCCVSLGDDTAESIHALTAIAYSMTVLQAGQGSYQRTRSIKDPVAGGRIEHQGKLPYWKCIESNVGANRQHTRGGSCTVGYDCLDPDFETHLRAKSVKTLDEKRIDHLDYSPALHPEIIRKALRNEDWMLVSLYYARDLHDLLFSSDEQAFLDEYERVKNDSSIPKKFINARELIILYGRIRNENGRLFRFNPKESNYHTPFKETIWSSNLCQEIFLPTYAYRDLIDLYSEDSEGEIA